MEYVTAEAREWNHVTVNKAMPQTYSSWKKQEIGHPQESSRKQPANTFILAPGNLFWIPDLPKNKKIKNKTNKKIKALKLLQ